MLTDRDTIVEVLDRLDDATDDAAALSIDVLTTPELLRVMERPERVARKLPVPQHAVINRLAARRVGHRWPYSSFLDWPENAGGWRFISADPPARRAPSLSTPRARIPRSTSSSW